VQTTLDDVPPPSKPIDDAAPIAPPPGMSPLVARIAAMLLLIVGVQAWLILGEGHSGNQHQPLLILLAIVLACVPPIRRQIDRVYRAIAKPPPLARLLTALLMAIISSVVLVEGQSRQHLDFNPRFQDEFSYALQTRMLAHGHLWLPAHPLSPFFETTYVLMQPVYASMYFPGTALMYIPLVWLHWPLWIGPAVVSGLSCGLLYLLITELLDGGCGLLAVVVLLSLQYYRAYALMLLSQPPMLLLGLVMTLAALYLHRARCSRVRLLLLAILGIAAGWGAITRPMDALCFAAIVAISLLVDLKRWPRRQTWWLAIPILTAAPFLLLQLYFNHGVTGQWLRTPFTQYTDQFYPGLGTGFRADVPLAHVSDLPQKQIEYAGMRRAAISLRGFGDLPGALWNRAKSVLYDWQVLHSVALAWLFLPLAVLGLWRGRLWLVYLMLPIFLIGYTFYSLLIPHYLLTAMAAIALLVVLPVRVLGDLFSPPWTILRDAVSLSLLALGIAALPFFDRTANDMLVDFSELQRINRALQNVPAPAVVLFHFNSAPSATSSGADNPEIEPVYNLQEPRIDDCPVIRAQDLNSSVTTVGQRGDRDEPLYAYYARIDPSRLFYLYDRAGGTGRLTRLGTAAALATRTSPQQDKIP
jgi:hypothetical protein